METMMQITVGLMIIGIGLCLIWMYIITSAFRNYCRQIQQILCNTYNLNLVLEDIQASHEVKHSFECGQSSDTTAYQIKHKMINIE